MSDITDEIVQRKAHIDITKQIYEQKVFIYKKDKANNIRIAIELDAREKSLQNFDKKIKKYELRLERDELKLEQKAKELKKLEYTTNYNNDIQNRTRRFEILRDIFIIEQQSQENLLAEYINTLQVCNNIVTADKLALSEDTNKANFISSLND